MDIFPARRVLIPMDMSPVSKDARQWARLFSAPDASCEALFVYDLMPAPMLGFSGPPLSARVRRKIVGWLKEIEPRDRHRVLEGDPAALILRRAADADLVVLGSHGRGGVGRLLLGSVSEAVARECPVPALIVRGAARPARSVLAPVNDALYARKGLELAAEAAAFLNAELTVLHVARKDARGPNPLFFINALIAGLPERLRAAVKPRVLLRAGEPVREILRESRRHGLIVLTAHRKPLLEDLVLGTTVERVLRHARAPVLTAPSSGR
jgi:nucleotide-binding universal stress UspA family protein